jgi:hypothetical protein
LEARVLEGLPQAIPFHRIEIDEKDGLRTLVVHLR